jgi:hypothetical protein
MFGFGESKKVADDNNWRKLEREAAKSKRFEGYRVEEQKQSKSTGKRPDIFAINPHDSRDRIVGEAKCVKELTPRHIQQARSYKGSHYAKEGVVFVARDTKVPHNVRAEARASNISIDRTNVSRKKGLLDGFI